MYLSKAGGNRYNSGVLVCAWWKQAPSEHRPEATLCQAQAIIGAGQAQLSALEAFTAICAGAPQQLESSLLWKQELKLQLANLFLA